MSIFGEKAKRRLIWPLLLILTLGLGVRMFEVVGNGLPYSYYPDEENNVKRALRLGANKTLDPGWFNKPALGYYFLTLEYGAYYGVGRLAGWWDDPKEFGGSYFENPQPFYLIGRISNTLFAILTIFITYRMGLLYRDRLTGYLAALGLALTMAHVVSSGEVKMDVPVAFWSSWALLWLMRWMKGGSPKTVLMAGLLIGLGAATKYAPLALLLPLTYAYLFRWPADGEGRRFRWWIAGVAAAGVGFFLGSPYNFLSGLGRGKLTKHFAWVMDRFGLSLGFAEQSVDRGSPLVDEHQSLMARVYRAIEVYFAEVGAGPMLAGLALVGLIVLLIRRERVGGLLVFTAISLGMALAGLNQQYSAPRHLAPLYPIGALLAAIGLQGAVSWATKGSWCAWSGATKQRASVVLFCALMVMPLLAVLQRGRSVIETDPRTKVLEWMLENLPESDVILNDDECIKLAPSLERCVWVLGERIPEIEASRPDAPIQFHKIGWRVLRDAAGSLHRPRRDFVMFLHPWFAESIRARIHAGKPRNPLWSYSPWGHLADRVLISREVVGKNPGSRSAREFGRVLFAAMLKNAGTHEQALAEWVRFKGGLAADGSPDFDQRPSLVELWCQESVLSRPWLTRGPDAEGALRAPKWFVSVEIKYSNYTNAENQKKRQNFPDWAEFYDDLHLNYDARQFGGDEEHPARVVRIWDLSQRREGKGTVKRVW